MKSKINWIFKNLHLIVSISIVIPTAIIYGSPSILPNYLDIQVNSIMAKDSLYMDDQDREIINQEIQARSQKGIPIVVLHGTDTMDLTASYCFEKSPNPQVAVVFTGAMKPMGFDDSDATQNVVEAIFAANILAAGYYVTFHGRLYKVPGFRKNRELGTFESI